ncbi:hypothetical protein Bhyg_01740, partial [Pseudolycoriella hygida]
DDDVLENHLQLEIPITIKNVLSFNSYDTIISLNEFNDNSIAEIEDCMRNVFEKDMLHEGETIADYLGKFTKVQKKFILLSGERKFIEIMATTCKRLYALQPRQDPTTPEAPPHTDENEIASDTMSD